MLARGRHGRFLCYKNLHLIQEKTMQKYIRLCFLPILIVMSPLTLAHDFWLAPEQFQIQAPSTVPILFKVGHKGDVEPWDLRWKRIVALRQYQQDGIIDLSTTVKPVSARNEGSANVIAQNAGTLIIGFESYHSVSELEAERFNSYASDEGLTRVIATRTSKGHMQKPGTEIYSRKAKAIIQAGDVYTDNVLKPIGHTLEIVPLTHPYKSMESDFFGVKVMYKGRPLANAKVHLVALDNAQIKEKAQQTNSQGEAEFSLPRQGKWMFVSAWAEPLENGDTAEFETYFASLTLGY
jgi:uncharacterized GH25 family protein